MAYGTGADCIEPDVVMTKDGALICLQDIPLIVKGGWWPGGPG